MIPVTISPFSAYACGCCAPGILLSLHFVAAVRPSELTLSPFLLVTLMDAMRSLDDSRATGDPRIT